MKTFLHLPRPRLAGILAGLVLAAALLPPSRAAAQEALPAAAPAAPDTAVTEKPNFGRAAAEVVGVNALVWTFNRFIREGGTNPVFRIGTNSWQENLETGWTWDDNSFSTNQIAHPYHGNLYFNAARSNGYTYWQSVPFAFAGSFMWEYFGEVHNPSMNDWIATSMGGAALGEILHRLARTVRDNTARGSSRNWREVGGLFIDPMGGVNRLMDGDWARVHANPPDRFPANYTTRMDLGLRTRGEERIWESDTTDVFITFSFDYGDPFGGDMDRPYDSFDFELQLNFGDKTRVGRVEGSGNLGGVFVKETDHVSHIVAGFHRYDYANTNALEFGGQSLTAGLLSRWSWDSGFELRTDLQAGPMILGGISSDYASVSARSYDYGPGSVVRFEAELRRGGWTWVRMRVAHAWLHSISGNVADHHVVQTLLRASVPVRYNLGLGVEFNVVNAERRYRDYDDVSRRLPQMRVYSVWGLN